MTGSRLDPSTTSFFDCYFDEAHRKRQHKLKVALFALFFFFRSGDGARLEVSRRPDSNGRTSAISGSPLFFEVAGVAASKNPVIDVGDFRFRVKVCTSKYVWCVEGIILAAFLNVERVFPQCFVRRVAPASRLHVSHISIVAVACCSALCDCLAVTRCCSCRRSPWYCCRCHCCSSFYLRVFRG